MYVAQKPILPAVDKGSQTMQPFINTLQWNSTYNMNYGCRLLLNILKKEKNQSS